jgi:hypothetical protein
LCILTTAEEHAEENLDFWEAAINYSQLEEDIERIDEAAKIFNQHFAQGAPQEINVPQTTQQAIEAKYTKGEVTLLDDVRRFVSTFCMPCAHRGGDEYFIVGIGAGSD